jgi:thiol-disulfide isomerase/thioredoxin
MKKFNLWLNLSVIMSLFASDQVMSTGKGEQLRKEKSFEFEVTKSDLWPEPTSYVGNIPVYEKFSDIEPMFHLDNDTTYIINFWATWCKPCLEELPYLEEVNEKYNDKKLKVILCSLDFPKQIESKLLPFVEKKNLKSTVVVLMDGNFNDWIDKVSPDWTGAIPVTYIYNGNKKHFVDAPIHNTQELEEIIKLFIHTNNLN